MQACFSGGLGRQNLKVGYEISKIAVDDLEASTNYIRLYYGQSTSLAPCPTGQTCVGFGLAVLYGEQGIGSNNTRPRHYTYRINGSSDV